MNQSTLKERKIQSPYNNVRSNQKHHVNEPIFKSHIKEESDQYISSISEDSSNESTLTDYKNRFKQSNNKTVNNYISFLKKLIYLLKQIIKESDS